MSLLGLTDILLFTHHFQDGANHHVQEHERGKKYKRQIVSQA
jgi:hypothetical protein